MLPISFVSPRDMSEGDSRFEVLTAALIKIMVAWDMTQFGFISKSRRFRCRKLIQNIGIYIPTYAVSYHR
jgi:hypothetical protein